MKQDPKEMKAAIEAAFKSMGIDLPENGDPNLFEDTLMIAQGVLIDMGIEYTERDRRHPPLNWMYNLYFKHEGVKYSILVGDFSPDKWETGVEIYPIDGDVHRCEVIDLQATLNEYVFCKKGSA